MNEAKQETPDLRGCLNLAVEIAREASLSISPDSDKSIVINLERDVKIEGDLRLNRLIAQRLKEGSPYSVLSEEEGFSQGKPGNKEYRWIVDPLDGSLNFSRDIPFFCISIALWRGDEPLIGVVYDFNHKEMFTGLVGEGAWVNDFPTEVGQVEKKEDAVLCTGFPVGTDFSGPALTGFVRDIQLYKKVRLLGSAALSLVYVACGRADVYHESDIAIWDVAAGIAIVPAAGGKVNFCPTKAKNRLTVKAGNNLLLTDA